MFRHFERLIDPYQAYDERAEFPNRLIPFYVAMLWPVLRILLFSLLMGLIFALAEAALIRYAGQLVDVLATADPATFWNDHGTFILWIAIVAMLIRPLTAALDDLVMNQGYFPPMGALVRWRTHRKMLRQSLSFFTDDFAGRIANKQIQLAPALNDSVHQIIQALWYAVVYVIGVAIVLIETDVRLLLPYGMWFLGFVAVAWWFIPRITRAGKAVADARSTLAGRIVDSYTNIQTVKLFAHAEEEETYARDAMEDFRWVFHRETRIYTTLTFLISGLQIVLMGGVVGYALVLWQDGAISTGGRSRGRCAGVADAGDDGLDHVDLVHAVPEHRHRPGRHGDRVAALFD